MLEIRQLDDSAAMQAIFTRLARTPGQPPLSAKVGAPYREALARLMQQAGLKEAQFTDVETWAAALTLAQAARGAADGEGVDRALMAMAGTKPVEELEGTARQLGLFDALPEEEQRDLLDAVVAEAASAASNENRIEGCWRQGDMAAIARETGRGMLADPELRQALLVDRNTAWAERVAAMLQARGARLSPWGPPIWRETRACPPCWRSAAIPCGACNRPSQAGDSGSACISADLPIGARASRPWSSLEAWRESIVTVFRKVSR